MPKNYAVPARGEAVLQLSRAEGGAGGEAGGGGGGSGSADRDMARFCAWVHILQLSRRWPRWRNRAVSRETETKTQGQREREGDSCSFHSFCMSVACWNIILAGRNVRLHFLSRSANSRAWLSVFPYHDTVGSAISTSAKSSSCSCPCCSPYAIHAIPSNRSSGSLALWLSGYIELSRVKEPEAGGVACRGSCAKFANFLIKISAP